MSRVRGLDTPVRSILNDGTPVLLRPIEPGDAACLRDGMRRLSPESARLRFLGPVSRLSDRQVRYLTEVDHRDHIAWVAFDTGGPAPLGIGVARCIRLAERPDTAEMAITVVDSHQGRGLGARMFSVLAYAAARQGIRTMTAEVLRENAAAIALLKSLGGKSTSVRGTTARFELPVDPARVAAPPAGARRAEGEPRTPVSR